MSDYVCEKQVREIELMDLKKISLIIGTCLGLAACTPFERELAEEVVEDVIEYEEGASAPAPNPTYNNWTAPSDGHYTPSHGMTKHDDTSRVSNQRQYPPRHEKNRGFAGQNRGA